MASWYYDADGVPTLGNPSGAPAQKEKKKTGMGDLRVAERKVELDNRLKLGLGPINDQTYQQAIKQQVQAASPQVPALRDSPATRATMLGQALGSAGAPGVRTTASTPSYSPDTTVGGTRTQTPTTQTTTRSTSAPAYTTTTTHTPSIASATTTPSQAGTTVESLGASIAPSIGATTAPSAWMGQGIESILAENNDLISRMTETGNAQIAQLNSFYTGLLSQIEQMRRDLIARSERDQQELDPATMHTLELLRESAQENLRRVKEEANRRGILDSGIALAMEQESDKTFQQAEAGILSDRLSRLKEQLDAQLARLQEMAFGVQRDHGQTMFEAQRDLENRLMQARQYADTRLESALDRQMRTRDQMLKEALANAEMTGMYVNPQARSLVDQILQAKERNQAGTDPVAAAQADAARRQLTAMGIDANTLFGPNVSLEQAYRNAAALGQPTLQAQQIQFNQQQALQPRPSAPQTPNTATRNALVIARQYPDRETALAELQAQLPGFIAAGVDLDEVMKVINSLPERGQTRFTGPQIQ